MAWGLRWIYGDELKEWKCVSSVSPSLGALIGQILHMFIGNRASRVSLLLPGIFKRTKFSEHCRFSFCDSCGNSPLFPVAFCLLYLWRFNSFDWIIYSLGYIQTLRDVKTFFLKVIIIFRQNLGLCLWFRICSKWHQER